MGIAQSFEQRLEQFVEGFFARTFRSGLQPVELGRKLAREMGRTKTVTSSGVMVANHFTVALSDPDTERFRHFADQLRAELVTGLTAECQREGWKTLGPIQIQFETDPALKIGRFVIESRIVEGASQAPAHPPAAAPAAAAVAVSPVAPASAPPPAAQAAAAPANPRIVTADGTVHSLASGPVRVGRLQDCQIRFDDPNVSRHHAEFKSAGNGATVVDLGSTNGTLVNGVRIGGETALNDGDAVSVGNNALVYRT